MRVKTAIIFFVCIAFSALILGLVFVWNIHYHSKPKMFVFSHTVTVGQTHVSVDFARTEEEQTTGLSGQKSLEGNQGLLFVFDQPNYYGIWMKDMNFPIDVVWFDFGKRAILIKENFLPSSYPQVIDPPSPTNYILEVPAGFAESHQISIGDALSF